jgi:hypothetical protein
MPTVIFLLLFYHENRENNCSLGYCLHANLGNIDDYDELFDMNTVH